jgi:hypothetical protein
MSQLSAAQVASCAASWALANFVTPNITANFHLGQIQAAIQAVDAAFDTTLSAAVTAVGGSTTIANGLSGQITASMPGATVTQQTLLVCYVLMKRAGII